jgi:hypothetical protein
LTTDKEIYLILSRCPQYLYELSGLPSSGPSVLKSVELKDLRRTADGIEFPEEPSAPLTVVEVQFQKEQKGRNVYRRLFTSMALIQEQHPDRGVRGIIFFATKNLDPQSGPWKDWATVCYLDDLLAALEAREPDHPLVAVFKPLFIASVEELVTQAKTHYRKLHDRPLPPGLRDVLCEVFERWMLERLPTKTKHEISMILDLPDVRQTVCGRELLDEGRTEGIAEGKAKGIAEGKAELLALQAETRLGPLPDELKARIRQLPGDAFQALALKVLEWTQVEELQLWLASQPLAPHSTSGSGISEG